MDKPKSEDPQVSYVNDGQKDDLWTALKANFTLPPEEDPEKPVIEPFTTREKLSSGAGFLHTSSTGTRATARALQLLFNSSAFLNKRCS